MKLRNLINLSMALFLAIALSPSGFSQEQKVKGGADKTQKTAKQGADPAQKTTDTMQGKNTKEGAEQAQKAATVFKEIMNIPDKAIPKSVLDKADCIAVFPQVIKGGFIIGARGGRGVASCRIQGGWSAPAYFEMKGGSFGLQIGAQATDFVLLFMNEKAMDSLLKSKFTLGGEASVAAGPVGREAGAETDALMTAQVLSYSRSKGVFGGLELKGTA
ncbi:MAG: lipid-binding SYLF domain-containing protein, partial [Acidobacteria bacterium]|nr:lipid-binding SYLF domain-containing protein [Acidobacteriota bacterium]